MKPSGAPNILEPGELRRLLLVIRERRHKNSGRDLLLFEILMHTGARPCEVLALRSKDLLPYVKAVRMPTAKRRGRLSGKVWRDLPLPGPVFRRATIAAGVNPQTPLIRGPKGDPLTTRAARYLWDSYARRAGIQGRSMRALRATFATEWLEAGGDRASLAAALGHVSLDSTEHYIHARKVDEGIRALWKRRGLR